MKRITETDLVRGIKRYTQLYENKGLAYIVRNNAIQQRILRRNGSEGFLRNGKAGSPDLLLCVRGRFVGVECKRPGNRQSESQREAQEAIVRAGGLYWLVYSFDEFKTHFDRMISDGSTPL